MTSYPAAFYVNVFDGVAGTLEFNVTPGSHAYNPVDGGTIGDGRTVTWSYQSGPGAVLSISEAYPGSVATKWASSGVGEWVFNESTNRLSLAVNGSLPAMSTGVIPSGWLLREHAWEVEATGGSTVVPYSFSDANDIGDSNGIPLNQTPVYLVPYFGNYGTGAGVGDPIFSVVGGSVSGSTIGDAWVTLTFPKPLNPNQTLDVMNISITSTAGGSAVALPQSVINGITVGQTTNAYNQITALVFRVPLSGAALGVIKPGYSYNFPITITQSLTFLNGNDYGTSNVVIATGAATIAVAAESTGPTLSVGTLDVISGQGLRYASSYLNSDIFLGKIRLTYTASDPWGVNSAGTRLTGVVASGDATGGHVYVNPQSATNSGAFSGTFTVDFDTRGQNIRTLGGEGNPSTYWQSPWVISNPQYFVANLNSNGALTSYGSVKVASPVSASSGWGYANLTDFTDQTKPGPLFCYNSDGNVITATNGDTYASVFSVGIKVPFPAAFVSSLSITINHGSTTTQATVSSGISSLAVGGSLTLNWPNLTPWVTSNVPPELIVSNNEEMLTLRFCFAPGDNVLSYSNEWNYISYTVTDRLGVSQLIGTEMFRISSADSEWALIEAGGGSCVPYTARIQMADGSLKNAGAVQAGELVASYNSILQQIEHRPVKQVLLKGVQPCLRITLEDGRSFVCSEAHRLAVEAEGYYEAKSVLPGYHLVSYDANPAVVLSVEPTDPQEVLTFSIDDDVDHNYFADGVLAHNKAVYDCVPAGTPVTMADGTLTAIERVEPGDLVLAVDTMTGEHHAKPVVETFITVADALYTVNVADGHTLTATKTHVLLTGKGWMTIQALLDDPNPPKVRMDDGSFQVIESITKTDVPAGVKVYLLEVAGDHTLFVNHFASHNIKNMTP